jgi:soluble lytic murein transglycosylase-like protein
MPRGSRAKKQKRNRPLRISLRRVFLLAGILAVGLAVPAVAPADIYKFVDKDGVVHFSNVPTTSGKWVLVIREQRVQFNLGQNFEKYEPEIWKASQRYSVDYNLVRAVIKAESNFNPKAVSRAGAKGLMQLMPKTAAELGVRDSFDPAQNITGGTRYLRRLLDRYQGDRKLALAAYNWGMGNVENRLEAMPRETRNYILKVEDLYQSYSKV